MYKKGKLENGNWIELAELEILTELEIKEENTYVFYVGKLPENIEKQNELIENVLKVNKNEITRVTIGKNICNEKEDTGISSPGKCFCVIAHGKRRCETKYCNPHTCWFVPCGMGC
ncbi:MAG: hypothetical protein R2836_07980 [Chitinophagales bacterium]